MTLLISQKKKQASIRKENCHTNDIKFQKLPTGTCGLGLDDYDPNSPRLEENEKKQIYFNAGTETINQTGQASPVFVTM